MITASTLLKLYPSLPGTTKNILGLLVTQGGDPEFNMPGLPSLPSMPQVLSPAVTAALQAALADFELEFYQTVGVKFSRKGVPFGGVGAKVTETLSLKDPKPNVKVVPVFELGGGRGDE